MNNPCRYCGERYVGCHAECAKYIAWRKAYDDNKQKEIKGRIRSTTGSVKWTETQRKKYYGGR